MWGGKEIVGSQDLKGINPLANPSKFKPPKEEIQIKYKRGISDTINLPKPSSPTKKYDLIQKGDSEYEDSQTRHTQDGGEPQKKKQKAFFLQDKEITPEGVEPMAKFQNKFLGERMGTYANQGLE